MSEGTTSASMPAANLPVTGWARRWAMVLIFLIAVVNYADRWIFSVLIEPIKAEFGLSDTMVGLLTGPAFAIFYALVGIPLARIADSWNRRVLISACVSLWSLMTVLCGMAGNVVQLFLFRVGVGVGEAGATPPSHSLIADYYPPAERTGALSVFNLGPVIGSLVAGIGGSVLVALIGWRATLIWMGLPGIVIGLLAYLFLREPRRAPAMPDLSKLWPDMMSALRPAMRKPAFVHLLIGFTLNGFLLYGAFIWTLPFAMRHYDISVEELPSIAVPMSLIQAAMGLIAIPLSGWLGNRLIRRDIRWLCWICVAALLVSFPFYLAKFSTDNFQHFLILAGIAHLVLLLLASPAYAAIHLVIDAGHRAMVMAFILLVSNLVGMGAGPVLTGILSDTLQPVFGEASLQAAIIALLFLMPWAAFHFYRAARFIKSDAHA